MAHRVVITGLGQVSSLGVGVAPFWQALLRGEPGVVPLPELATIGCADPVGARVKDWDPRRHLKGRSLLGAALVSQFAVTAAAEAFESARLERKEWPRGGVFFGTGFGGGAHTEEAYKQCFTVPGARPGPTVIPLGMANAPAGLIAAELRLLGPNLTLSTACTSGSHAIGQAFRVLRAGDADLALAGGADAPLTPMVLGAWSAMRVLAPAGSDPAHACRPFDRNRKGFVLGEGAAFLVLETAEHAARRQAPVLAEVLGYGMNADAGHVTQPDPAGVRRAMELALHEARLAPEEVGYVNAHGTGTSLNDRVEAEAVAALFGEHAKRLLISSTKSMHGHAMGASGALEAIACVLAMCEGAVPPTATLAAIDPELPALDFVPRAARKASVRAAMSNSFAFGGNNAVLVLGR